MKASEGYSAEEQAKYSQGRADVRADMKASKDGTAYYVREGSTELLEFGSVSERDAYAAWAESEARIARKRRWVRKLCYFAVVGLVLALARGQLSTRSTQSQAANSASASTVPALPPIIQALGNLPNVGDCIVKKPGQDKYEVGPCSRPHFGKVVKHLQMSDFIPPNIGIPGAGWKCPHTSDGVLQLDAPPNTGLLPENYCIDTN
jgi:hypothetical protein